MISHQNQRLGDGNWSRETLPSTAQGRLASVSLLHYGTCHEGHGLGTHQEGPAEEVQVKATEPKGPSAGPAQGKGAVGLRVELGGKEAGREII